MKKHLLLLLILSFALNFSPTAKAQTLELLGGNTLNGAMNGVILGGATMALQNSNNFEPVRVGLGAGVLYGIGVGVYDISQIDQGQQFYISGTFNDGTNSSILVLLDTFYGAAGGALIASSVALIVKAPLTDALQYGSGIGAWLGFGFGLVDAFVLAKGPHFGQQNMAVSQSSVGGLLTYKSASESVKIGLLNPALFQQKEIAESSLKTTYHPTLQVINLNIGF